MEIRHEELIDLLFAGYKAKVPLDIKGPVGIGKSQLTHQSAVSIGKYEKKEKFVYWNEISEIEKEKYLNDEELEKAFIFADLRLSQFDQTDLKGFPITTGKYAIWKSMLLFKVLSNPKAIGLVFFDEMNLAMPSVTASAYQIVNDHSIGETPISKGVYIVSAGNRLEDTNNAFEDPAPLNNRRMNVELLPPSIEAWTEWAAQHDVDPRIIAYLQWKQSNLFKYDPESKDASFPSPRMWAKSGDMIKDVKDERKLRTYLSACVGEGVARELVAFIKLKEKVNIRELLKNPELIKKYRGAEHIDTKYSVISGVAELYSREHKILNDAMCLCKYIEPEFSMFMLRLMKNMYKGASFVKELLGCKNWAMIAPDFSKYLLE